MAFPFATRNPYGSCRWKKSFADTSCKPPADSPRYRPSPGHRASGLSAIFYSGTKEEAVLFPGNRRVSIKRDSIVRTILDGHLIQVYGCSIRFHSTRSPCASLDLSFTDNDVLLRRNEVKAGNWQELHPYPFSSSPFCYLHYDDGELWAMYLFSNGSFVGRCVWRGGNSILGQMSEYYSTCSPNIAYCPNNECDELERSDLRICPQDCVVECELNRVYRLSG